MKKKKECDAKTNRKILTKSYTVCEYTHNQNSDFLCCTFATYILEG